MTRDRGVRADIWERHEQRAEQSERRQALRLAAETIFRAIQQKPARFLSSVREELLEGHLPTAKQIEAVNNILKARGFPVVKCPTRDDPVRAAEARNSVYLRERRAAVTGLGELQASRPLQPPGRKVTW